MIAWTAVAWVIDAGAMLCLLQVIQRHLQVFQNHDSPWQGTMVMIVLMTVLAISIVGSAALILASEARWARITALLMAGAVPGAGVFVMSVMALGAIAAAVIGGRLN
ncbi:MAG: hypothetical protein HY246_20855 [Proteobacteria bacterium]|nr:hypothetical protein [Pseudomonadota bacterium]